MAVQPLYPWLNTAWQTYIQIQQAGRLSHALIVQSQAGLGIEILSQYMSQSLICIAFDGTSCQNCKGCKLFLSGNHPDIHNIQTDKNQITVDTIRELINQAHSRAHQGGNKVFIIHEAEKMNRAATNAVLKIVEEPYPNTYFILLTYAPYKLLATIRSRCQMLSIQTPEKIQAENFISSSSSYDAKEIQQALAIHAGAPIAAMDFLANNGLEKREQCLQSLQSYAHIHKVQMSIDKTNVAQYLMMYWQIIADMIKIQLDVETITHLDVQSQLTDLSKQQSLQNLYQLLEIIQDKIKQVAFPIYPTPAFVFLDIMSQWYKTKI